MDKDAPAVEASPLKTPDAAPSSASSQPTDGTSRALTRYEKITLGVALLNLSTVVLYTCFSYQQWQAMRHANEITNRSVEAMIEAQRARPGVVSFDRYPLEAGSDRRLTLELSNSSSMPATLHRMITGTFLVKANDPIPDTNALNTPLVPARGIIDNLTHLRYSVDAMRLTDEQVRMVREKLIQFYFVAKFEYDDGFDRRRVLPLCRVHDGVDRWLYCDGPAKEGQAHPARPMIFDD